ncbi:MAG: hypothetical protein JWO33_1442, partial [Caulobacteraceae bacterium]|nr:hypothetical protein [Caulobacteraceae bacterium]
MTGKVSPNACEIAGRRRVIGLRFGPPLVSLTALVWAGQASAETSVASARTTPISTSTAASGAPDNITITADGSVKPPSGVAVTLDSDNTVSNSGTIQIQDVSDTTGVLVLGGHTGAVTNSNAITFNETAVAVDSDGDGNLDGAFASGVRRFGVRVIGPGAFTGTITNAAGGMITVQGDDSAGVSVETDLQGALANLGAISVIGSRSVAVRTTGAVGGDVTLFGSIIATGEAAQGVALDGDVLGGVVVQGTITATGYRYTTRSTDTTFLSNLDSNDLLQGGSALTIKGNVARGLFLDAAPLDLDPNNADEDGDGTPDASETTASVASYGAAPAIVVGAVGRDVSLGNVGAGDLAYGVVIKGAVLGSGVYDGVSATGLQLGVAGGGAVSTGGGVHVTGSVTGTSYAADATALLLNRGASAPLLRNDGVIGASVIAEGLVAARAVDIEAGASTSLLQNAGVINAGLSGEKGDATAVLDRSGTLTTIQNVGTIAAVITPTDDANDTDDADTNPLNEVITGKAVAIDVSANSTGVGILQFDTSAGLTPPAIIGEIRFGSGSDRLDVLGGSVTGAITFGAGANALTIDGGATVAGAITANGGTLGLAVGNGSLQIDNIGVINLSSLSLASTSQLMLTVDPAGGGATQLNVAGAANLASGAKIGVRLTSLLKNSATYTLIRADSLTVASLDTTLLGSVPYLYTSSLLTNAGAGTVSLALSRRSAADLNLPAATSAAYEPLIVAIDRDADLRNALLMQTDRAGFMALYNQFLPNHSGGVFQLAAASVDGFSRSIDDRQDTEGGGVPVQELNTGILADSQTDQPGYKGWGIGMVGGYEMPALPFGVLGLTFGLSSSQLNEDGSAGAENLTTNLIDAGGYWRLTRGAFSVNAHVAGDYLTVSSDRLVQTLGADGLGITRTATGHWSGYGVNGRVRASYELHLRNAYLRPQASV